jgi:hypothetical protein
MIGRRMTWCCDVSHGKATPPVTGHSTILIAPLSVAALDAQLCVCSTESPGVHHQSQPPGRTDLEGRGDFEPHLGEGLALDVRVRLPQHLLVQPPHQEPIPGPTIPDVNSRYTPAKRHMEDVHDNHKECMDVRTPPAASYCKPPHQEPIPGPTIAKVNADIHRPRGTEGPGGYKSEFRCTLEPGPVLRTARLYGNR